MSATVTVSKARNGKFRVTLTSSRGKELLTSEPFSDKRTAAGLVRTLRGALPGNTAFVDSTTAATNGTTVRRPAAASGTGAAKTATTTRRPRKAQ